MANFESTSKTIETTIICMLSSAAIGAVLHCFILPLLFLMLHDSGNASCHYSYPMEWQTYNIVTCYTFFVLIVIALIEDSARQSDSMPKNLSLHTRE